MTSFDRMRAASRRPAIHALEPPATVDILPADAKLPTEVKLTTEASLATVDTLPKRRIKVRPATLVQHGHTSGEHALYMAMWNLASDIQREYREVSIGYDKIAATISGSKRNVKRITDALIRKLAIEIVGSEISGIRQGKTYRVYSMGEILKRRRDAGLTHVVRDRCAVDFVKMSTVDNLPTVVKVAPESVVILAGATVASLTTPFSNKDFRNTVGDICKLCGGTGEKLVRNIVRGVGTTARVKCSCRK